MISLISLALPIRQVLVQILQPLTRMKRVYILKMIQLMRILERMRVHHKPIKKGREMKSLTRKDKIRILNNNRPQKVEKRRFNSQLKKNKKKIASMKNKCMMIT